MCKKLEDSFDNADTDLYHHTYNLQNSANDNSYRYSGNNEKIQNWVCFGADSEVCDDEHLYRIIGVFNEKIIEENGNTTNNTEERVKLIKGLSATDNSLGTSRFNGYYYWSGSGSTYSTKWQNSTLNTGILNGTYLTQLGETWTSKIAITEWKSGGNSFNMLYSAPASFVYQREIINPYTNSTVNTKVGLMYVNDYAYATIPKNWTTSLSLYNNDDIKNSNWLFNNTYEWTISSCGNDLGAAFQINSFGDIGGHSVSGVSPIRPTFYLNSDVVYTGGTGTKTDPYRIA